LDEDGRARLVKHLFYGLLGDISMSSYTFLRSPITFLFCFAVSLSILLLSAPNCPAGDDPAQVVRVEEDWEMALGTPEPESDAPQVTCVIAPYNNLDSLHAAFTLNHQGLPEYVAGGLQLQIWNGETSLSAQNFPNTNIMSQSGETVSWTQSMELKEGKIIFEILNGNSTTWGQFGGQGYLKAIVDTTLPNLNQYSPSVSVSNSGISYASNRVQSLVLKRVRLILGTGEIVEDDTVRTVHQL
jgi:hypothetical protein